MQSPSVVNNCQYTFFKNITDEQLNEFLFRIDDKTFARHILQQLHNSGIYNIIVKTKLKHSNTDVSAYINYHYNKQKRIHFSLHLTGNNFHPNMIGPLHVVNNTRKLRSPIKCKHTRKLSLNISHRNTVSHQKINNKIKINILNNTTKVINDYFNSGNPDSLTIKLSTPSNILHPLLLIIIHERKLTSAPIIQTALTIHKV
jgi:hypothetical protein